MLGRRYIDVESGKTVDAYFPDDPSAGRSCLAVKYGVIVDEEISLEADLDTPISGSRTHIFGSTSCHDDWSNRTSFP